MAFICYNKCKPFIIIAISISFIQLGSSFTANRNDESIATTRRSHFQHPDAPHTIKTKQADDNSVFSSRGGGDLTVLAMSPTNSVTSPREESSYPVTTPSSSRAYSYYLLWSPGFATKFLTSSLLLSVLHFTGVSQKIGMMADRLFHASTGILAASNIGSNFLLPLLSSSCCLIQLVINMVVGAGGCAGFNTALGPSRPFFLSFLAFLTIVSRQATSLSETLLRFSLALLPEFVHFWNEWISSRQTKENKRKIELLQKANSLSNNIITTTMTVDIPAMGCVACINKIDATLRDCAPGNVLNAKSWLDADQPKGGRAEIKFVASSEEELNSLKERILETIDGTGFGGSSVISLESSHPE